jgi:HSP20 family protein
VKEMAIRRWEPFGGLERLREEMDKLFEDFFPARWLRPRVSGIRLPAIDLRETENELILKADLPGVKKEDLAVEVTPEAITVKGETREGREEKKEDYHCCERVWGSFERVVPLPVEVKADAAKAKFADGVLEISVPKTAAAKAKQPVKVKIE